MKSRKAIQSTLLKIKNGLHQVLLEATKRSYLSVPVFCCCHLPRNTSQSGKISSSARGVQICGGGACLHNLMKYLQPEC
ncbi:hypothetical protein POPTR_006G072950v4 [Populus trichocarpa]|uniref:Uncharacterized protein n=1 Tax=Populus trichocarpa TaxID=3694 RepID=A0ACC0SSR6_POPTR|nr:hypothetical protein POPTR_006G072950v4 [Populus trichocarpa]